MTARDDAGSEGAFSVVWPLGRSTREEVALNARLSEPDGKRIGFVWDYVFRGDEIFELLEAELRQHFPSMSFVPYADFGNILGETEREVIAALPERLRATDVDAVVVGVGA
jgi:hypothetical protein